MRFAEVLGSFGGVTGVQSKDEFRFLRWRFAQADYFANMALYGQSFGDALGGGGVTTQIGGGAREKEGEVCQGWDIMKSR